jgi:hypothetical protein
MENAGDTITLDHVQISGQVAGTNCGPSADLNCDQMHGIVFSSGNIVVRDTLIKYIGDCLNNSSDRADGNITVLRTVCERGSASGNTAGFLDTDEGTSTVTASVTDSACIRCTEPINRDGGGRLMEHPRVKWDLRQSRCWRSQ